MSTSQRPPCADLFYGIVVPSGPSSLAARDRWCFSEEARREYRLDYLYAKYGQMYYPGVSSFALGNNRTAFAVRKSWYEAYRTEIEVDPENLKTPEGYEEKFRRICEDLQQPVQAPKWWLYPTLA